VQVGWLGAELVGILLAILNSEDPSGVSLSLTVHNFSMRLRFSTSLAKFMSIAT